MSVLSLVDISKSYGEKVLFKNLNFSIMQGKKVALFGDNGSGKTTLLKIIAGVEDADTGKIIASGNLKIGYLEQIFYAKGTIFDFMLESNKQLLSLEIELENCEDPDKLSELYERFEKEGGLVYRSNIREILTAFAFSEDEWGKDLSSLSGGELERLKLARLLSSEANFLILDEPTNYLDIVMIDWLEKFLQSTNKTVLFVTHDRRLLEKIADEVLYLANQTIYHYKCGFNKFLSLYKNSMERVAQRKTDLMEEAEKLRLFIDKYRAGVKSKQITVRMKNLKRIEEELQKYNFDFRNIDFSFKKSVEENHEVVIAKNIVLGYSDTRLTKPFSFKIYKGEKVALVGKNGSGKTTLLKSIKGDFNILEGDIKLGDRVKIGYYEQIFEIKSDRTVFEELLDIEADITLQEIYNVLPKFGIEYGDLEKRLYMLSGGELSKILLIKLYFERPNLLLLDEPTNHLDYETVDVLKNALINYDGTIVMVSHDRYFMDGLIEKFIFFQNGEVEITDKLPYLNALEIEEKNKKVKKVDINNKRKKVDKYKLNALKDEIAEIENYLSKLYLEKEKALTDWEKLAKLMTVIDEKELELLNKYEELDMMNKEEL